MYNLKKHNNNNFESHNSQKLTFANIKDFGSNFISCEFFLESNSLNIFALCETNLEESMDSRKFSVKGYLCLTEKDSFAHDLFSRKL